MSAQLERIATSPLDPNFAAQNVPPKPPVSHQTEPRVFERCGLVVLEEEVADPGERVTLHERCRSKPPPLRDHGSDEQRDGNARAGEVQSPAGAVGVLAEIEGIEIAESPKRVLVVHGDSPSRTILRYLPQYNLSPSHGSEKNLNGFMSACNCRSRPRSSY